MSVHYGEAGLPAACGVVTRIATIDTDHVTCTPCTRSTVYARDRAAYLAVVDSWAPPKEEIPCLNPPTETP